MNKKHKHHDVIVAWAAGQTVQYREVGFGAEWEDAPSPLFSEKTEYRIKPEPPAKVYPVTGMTRNDFNAALDVSYADFDSCSKLANAALRHAIDSGQLIEPNPARDMAIAKAVRDWYVSDKDDAQLARLIGNVKD